jgi:uncharacterized oxidoreductase
MKLSGNTILITGGSSGIGLELSRRFSEAGSTIIICGRSEGKLAQAKKELPELHTYSCDLSDKQQCYEFAAWVSREFPQLNLLINNAAIVHKTSFLQTAGILEMAEIEMQTNFLAPVRLIHGLHPVLKRNPAAAIVNITTGLIYAPRADYPFYNSTKAALHSFTQVLRKQIMDDSDVRVIEVMFPAVETPWHEGKPPKIAISTEEAVDGMLSGLKKDQSEIRVGGAKLLYNVSRIAPGFAFRKVNSLAD